MGNTLVSAAEMLSVGRSKPVQNVFPFDQQILLSLSGVN
jgi:hypothetical protein